MTRVAGVSGRSAIDGAGRRTTNAWARRAIRRARVWGLRLVGAAGVAVGLSLAVLAAPAWAHPEPDPPFPSDLGVFASCFLLPATGMCASAGAGRPAMWRAYESRFGQAAHSLPCRLRQPCVRQTCRMLAWGPTHSLYRSHSNLENFI